MTICNWKYIHSAMVKMFRLNTKGLHRITKYVKLFKNNKLHVIVELYWGFLLYILLYEKVAHNIHDTPTDLMIMMYISQSLASLSVLREPGVASTSRHTRHPHAVQLVQVIDLSSLSIPPLLALHMLLFYPIVKSIIEYSLSAMEWADSSIECHWLLICVKQHSKKSVTVLWQVTFVSLSTLTIEPDRKHWWEITAQKYRM